MHEAENLKEYISMEQEKLKQAEHDLDDMKETFQLKLMESDRQAKNVMA